MNNRSAHERLLQTELSQNDQESVTETRTTPVRNRILIALSLLSVYVIWGTTYLAIRVGLDGFPPFMLIGIRFTLAGLLLYIILRLRGAPAPDRSQWLGSIVIGTLLLAAANGGVAFAEQWVATGLAAIGIAAVPLWTALFGGIWGRWPRRIEWFGLALGFAGVVLLYIGNGIWANPLGAIALFIAPMCWGLGATWSRSIALPAGMMSSATEMLAGGVVLILVSFVTREKAPNLANGQSLLALVFLIIFGSLIAFSAFTYLMRHVRPTIATSYGYVNPIVAVILGALLAREHLTVVEIVAILIILAGIGIISSVRKNT